MARNAAALTGFAVGLIITTASPITAQTVLSGDTSIDGRGCIGVDCDGSETFQPQDTLKIEAGSVSVTFEDGSDAATTPDRDWRLLVNDNETLAAGGIERFSVEDIDAGTIPFTIEGGAPGNSFYVSTTTGHVGLGTSLPTGDLHIVAGTSPRLILEQDGSDGNSPYSWMIVGADDGFTVFDILAGGVPFTIDPGNTEFGLLTLHEDKAGLGTVAPDAKLHILAKPSGSSYPYGLLVTDIPLDTADAFAQIKSDTAHSPVKDRRKEHDHHTQDTGEPAEQRPARNRDGEHGYGRRMVVRRGHEFRSEAGADRNREFGQDQVSDAFQRHR